MSWLIDNSWAMWLGAALALAAVEAATADFIFLMLAGGALAGLVTGLVTPSPVVQVMVAGVTALALLGTVRPVLKRRLLDGLPGIAGVESYASRPALVTSPVDEHGGRVKFDGETWSARTDGPTDAIPAGTEVVVSRVEGATLVVELPHQGRGLAPAGEY